MSLFVIGDTHLSFGAEKPMDIFAGWENHTAILQDAWYRSVAPEDTEKEAVKLADKVCGCRVFEDENGKMNLNLETVGGSLLVISQFTLYADLKSRRPGFSRAAKPDLAVPLYEHFMAKCRERGFRVECGEFGADMKVASVNDGPVTLLFDTDTL